MEADRNFRSACDGKAKCSRRIKCPSSNGLQRCLIEQAKTRSPADSGIGHATIGADFDAEMDGSLLPESTRFRWVLGLRIAAITCGRREHGACAIPARRRLRRTRGTCRSGKISRERDRTPARNRRWFNDRRRGIDWWRFGRRFENRLWKRHLRRRRRARFNHDRNFLGRFDKHQFHRGIGAVQRRQCCVVIDTDSKEHQGVHRGRCAKTQDGGAVQHLFANITGLRAWFTLNDLLPVRSGFQPAPLIQRFAMLPADPVALLSRTRETHLRPR